ncbi:MAG TPA: hypothetical protein VMV16_06955 [Solirubrobacteraceae bacterium]|nr:hypothetical protein [Solirubrobacteraceae bacterium]
MWRETIAWKVRCERLAARVVTGPAAFLVAGLLDVVAVLWWLATHRRGRSY